MKTILCYGDSNTWGYRPENPGGPGPRLRFGLHERWPGVMRDDLGDGYWVIEEALNGRTTVWPDPIEGEYKSGKHTLLALLESHHPLDLVILMLGTNDLKVRFSLSPRDVASGIGTLLQAVAATPYGPDGAAPPVLLVAPPPFERLNERLGDMFTGGVPKSRALAPLYRDLAAVYGCRFLDSGEFASGSPPDGLHLDLEGHRRLGLAVAAKVREILD